jgi:hypothetical protein
VTAKYLVKSHTATTLITTNPTQLDMGSMRGRHPGETLRLTARATTRPNLKGQKPSGGVTKEFSSWKKISG